MKVMYFPDVIRVNHDGSFIDLCRHKKCSGSSNIARFLPSAVISETSAEGSIEPTGPVVRHPRRLAFQADGTVAGSVFRVINSGFGNAGSVVEHEVERGS